jgi:hypothetical protein
MNQLQEYEVGNRREKILFLDLSSALVLHAVIIFITMKLVDVSLEYSKHDLVALIFFVMPVSKYLSFNYV